LFAGLIMAAALLESGLRLHVDHRATTFVGVPELDADKVADSLLVVWFKPDYQGPDAAYDQYGLRLNGEPRADDPPHSVALLGGSTAYGWGVADDQTISATMERDLGRAHEGTVVLNAGFPGLTTLDTVLVYHSKLAPLRPSTVVVLAGLNDLYYAVDWGPRHRLYWLNDVFEVSLRARHDTALQPVVDAVDAIALRQCFSCFYASASLSKLFDRTRFAPMLSISEWLGQQPLAAPNERAMQLTAWALQELARRVRADNGCLIVAWQPMAGLETGARTPSEQAALDALSRNAPAWPSVAPDMFGQLRAATRQLFASGAAREVDLTDLFDGVDQQLFVDDGVHYNPRGNMLIAQALEPAVSAGCETRPGAA
jgi:lysophospholipase L1-like esterase